MIRNEKDVIYLTEQPRHTILSIIVMNDEFPLSDKLHEDIEKLLTKTDVILIFSDKYFPKVSKINKERFANIYRVNGWVDSKENIAKTIIDVLNYSLEIFKSHTSFVLFNSWEMNKFNDTLLNDLYTATLTVSRPVFRTIRLNSNEYYQIYKTTEEENKESKNDIFSKIKNYFKNLYFKLFKINKENDYLLKSYSSYTTDATAVFFKAVTAKNIVEFCKDPYRRDYINSFAWNNFKYLFVSLIKKLNIETINTNLSESGLNLTNFKEIK